MVSASERLSHQDRRIRLELLVVSACWLGLAIANLSVSETIRWYPDVVGVFAGLTTACTLFLILKPAVFVVFRFGGALAIGTLLLRLASIIEGLVLGLSNDAVWLGLAAVAVTNLLMLTYWRWWLTDIRLWHIAHKMAGRSR